MIILFIVGVLFIILAFLMNYQRSYYRKYGIEVQGAVMAIEKVTSRRFSSGDASSSSTYTPIIEYSFNSERVKVSGFGGRNLICHKIGQRVKLLCLKDGPEYTMLKKGTSSTFVGAFSVIGFGAILFALYRLLTGGNSLFSILIQILFITFGAILTFREFSKARGKFKVREFLKGAKLESEKSLKDPKRTIYFSNRKIVKVQKKFNKIGLFIAVFFLLGAVGGLIYFWQGLSESQQRILLDIKNYRAIIELIKGKDPQVIGTCITTILTLMGIHSFFYSLKKSEEI